IRPVTPADSPVLSTICLETGAAGASAASLHTIPTLLGLVYAEPYAHLKNAWGFVLEEQTGSRTDVVGYILGALDTEAYEKELETSWWPSVREAHPISLVHHDPSVDPSNQPLSPADIRLIQLFHIPPKTPAQLARLVPAHMHINLLRRCQGKGYGRKLIERAIEHIREQGHAYNLSIDPANTLAREFYLHMGY
ncbi:uncharacterized protein EI90DRAFT_2836558, partial [Cantharellus anzutake]|uniref:uncharacterized protein n=1 Tax=Cantharellus anzutake TaxID=1750568 RepID=UPI0019063B93